MILDTDIMILEFETLTLECLQTESQNLDSDSSLIFDFEVIWIWRFR